jgi:Flp pilus assembly protein TadB
VTASAVIAAVLVLAHAGHWIVSALYVLPVLVIVGALTVQGRLEKRRARRQADDDAPQP